MNPSNNETYFAPNSRPSVEEVLQQYLADCQKASGGSPPDPESYLRSLDDPDRSLLRARLDEIRSKFDHPISKNHPGSAIHKGTKSGGSDETGIHVPSDSPNGRPPLERTIDHIPTPDDTVDQVEDSDGTVDHADETNRTGEYIRDSRGPQVDSPTKTFDYVPSDKTGEYVAGSSPTKDYEQEQKPSSRALPQSVAGYEVLKVLGRGAMGVVYKARQRGLKRLVALKMILSGEHASEQDLARFQAEANAVAQLHHPGIVQIYEIGEDNGRPFFSLEFVDGPSLHKKLQGNPMAPKETAVLMKQMAEAMDYAHQRGVIHRDLKPANVLLTSDGVPKIGDFGLAKSLDDDESGLTKTGTVMGTPSYMSPEQAMGLIAEIGPLADVYSLGAMLYDMLTGRPPFRGTSVMDTLQQLRTREPVPPMQLQPSVPRDLETICLKCLQKEKTKRYESAGALAADIGRFLEGRPILARPVSSFEKFWRFCKRNPRESISASIVLMGLIIFSAVLWIKNDQYLQQKRDAEVAKGVAEQKTIEANNSALSEKIQKEKEIEARRVAEAEKSRAEQEEEKARKAREFAELKKTEAEEAQNSEKKAHDETKKQVEIQRQTARDSLLSVQALGNLVINFLQSKRVALDKSPDVQRMRASMMKDLQALLTTIASRTQEKLTAENFGDLQAMQIMADFLLKLGQKEEPIKLYTQARNKLLENLPKSTVPDKARANLGLLEQRLGDVALQTEGDAHTALKQYVTTRKIHVELQKNPNRKEMTDEAINRSVGHDDMHVGKALISLGRSAEAIQYFEEALMYYTEWSKSPKNKTDEPRSYMMAAHMMMGIAKSRMGDFDGAEKSFKESLAISQVILPRNGRFRGYLIDQAEVEGEYGDALFRAGKMEEALKLYQVSLKDLTEAYGEVPDDLEHQPLLALANERLGVVSRLLKDEPTAKPLLENAKQLRGELVAMEQTNIARRMGLILSLAHAGNLKNALELAKKNVKSMENSTELTLQMARCFSLCSSPNANLKETAEQFQDRKLESIKLALSSLQLATKDDYKDAAVIEAEPDFAVLKDEPDFKELIATIKARSK